VTDRISKARNEVDDATGYSVAKEFWRPFVELAEAVREIMPGFDIDSYCNYCNRAMGEHTEDCKGVRLRDAYEGLGS
jgi:hypothetical protein